MFEKIKEIFIGFGKRSDTPKKNENENWKRMN